MREKYSRPNSTLGGYRWPVRGPLVSDAQGLIPVVPSGSILTPRMWAGFESCLVVSNVQMPPGKVWGGRSEFSFEVCDCFRFPETNRRSWHISTGQAQARLLTTGAALTASINSGGDGIGVSLNSRPHEARYAGGGDDVEINAWVHYFSIFLSQGVPPFPILSSSVIIIS